MRETAVREVQQATQRAMEAVIDYLHTASAPTSEEAHTVIDDVLAQCECESPEGRICASGTASAEPHEYGRGTIEPGTPVVIDIYPRSKQSGYFADMSRTVCVGAPSRELQDMFDAVREAQELGISMVKPGARCGDIHEAVEHFFIERGYTTSGSGTEFPYAEGFVHALGHGVGRAVHEAPRIGRGSEDVLKEGDVITIEPGLYYFSIGGVRLEDMLLVTADGAENLTVFPKQLATR